MVRERGLGTRTVARARSTAEAPSFLRRGGEGEARADSVAREVGAVFQKGQKHFPRASLGTALEAATTEVADYGLEAWGARLEKDLRDVVQSAATTSFVSGAEAVDLSTAGRGWANDYCGELGRAATGGGQKAARGAEEEVQWMNAEVSQIVQKGVDKSLRPEDIVAEVDFLLASTATGRRGKRIAWSVVFRWWHAGRDWRYRREGATHKIWHLSTGVDNCPICLGNEDAGEIEAALTFPSGHSHPLAHPWCHCWNEYTGLPKRR